jgi:hypothetical protein
MRLSPYSVALRLDSERAPRARLRCALAQGLSPSTLSPRNAEHDSCVTQLLTCATIDLTYSCTEQLLPLAIVARGNDLASASAHAHSRATQPRAPSRAPSPHVAGARAPRASPSPPAPLATLRARHQPASLPATLPATRHACQPASAALLAPVAPKPA